MNYSQDRVALMPVELSIGMKEEDKNPKRIQSMQ